MVKRSLPIGVLALQGNFDSHLSCLQALPVDSLSVKKMSELDSISGLIIPGGESSTMLRLMGDLFFHRLSEKIKSGFPIMGTCAGLILLAKTVNHPKQKSFSALDIKVQRNAYGTQTDSFIQTKLDWTDWGKKELTQFGALPSRQNALFIRAPKIESYADSVQVLAKHQDSAVIVRQNNALGIAFHPELEPGFKVLHQYFAHLCQAAA